MASWFGRTALVSCAVTGIIANVGGCTTTQKLPKNDVANQISSKLSDASGKPDEVSCPDDLKPTVGATLECQLKAKGQTYPVKVTVTSIEGNQAKFDIVEMVDKIQVEKMISDLIAQTQQKPDSVSCPENLKAIQGQTITCEMAQSGHTYSVTVDVAGVAAGAPTIEINTEQPK